MRFALNVFSVQHLKIVSTSLAGGVLRSFT
jgi:hypothetical protein